MGNMGLRFEVIALSMINFIKTNTNCNYMAKLFSLVFVFGLFICLALSTFGQNQAYPDVLLEMQKGVPNLEIVQFRAEQLPHTLSANDKLTFYPEPLIMSEVVIKNVGEVNAIAGLSVDFLLPEVNLPRTASQGLTLLDMIMVPELRKPIKFKPLTIILENNDVREDYPKGLNILTLQINTIDTALKLEKAIERGDYFFYELAPLESIKYGVKLDYAVDSDNGTLVKLPEYIPTGLISSWHGLSSGEIVFQAYLYPAANEEDLTNNYKSLKLGYDSQFYFEGPAIGVTNLPDLTDDQVFVFGELGKCKDAKLGSANLSVCLEGLSVIHAGFKINGKELNFGILGRWLKFKEEFELDGVNFQAVLYSNGIKISKVMDN